MLVTPAFSAPRAIRLIAVLAALQAVTGSAAAEPPDILAAEARPSGSGWSVAATIAHPDTGWDHYADGFRVETADGTVLAMRELLHPHVTEQPFTRSATGIELPAGVTLLHVRARCNVTGWSSKTVTVALEN